MRLFFITIPFLLFNPHLTGRIALHDQAASGGQELYNKYCLACHQTDGSGVPGMFPPLVKTEKVLGPAGELVKIILTGLSGTIEIGDEMYDSAMPALDYLSDKDISAILTFVRNNWGNRAKPVSPKEVAKVRSEIKKTP